MRRDGTEIFDEMLDHVDKYLMEMQERSGGHFFPNVEVRCSATIYDQLMGGTFVHNPIEFDMGYGNRRINFSVSKHLREGYCIGAY